MIYFNQRFVKLVYFCNADLLIAHNTPSFKYAMLGKVPGSLFEAPIDKVEQGQEERKIRS